MDMLADEPLHTSTEWLTRNSEAANKPGLILVRYTLYTEWIIIIGRGVQ